MAEVLVITSKIKAFMKEQGMNTSGNVPEALSKVVRDACLAAIEKAKKDRRKTVMDRDFE